MTTSVKDIVSSEIVWSPVFVPDIWLVPFTESVGLAVPQITTQFTLLGVMSPSTRVISGVVVADVTVPEIQFVLLIDTEDTVPPAPVATNCVPTIERPAPREIGAISPEDPRPKRVLAVSATAEISPVVDAARARTLLAATFCIFAKVTTSFAIVVAFPTDVTSPVIENAG